MTKIVHSIFFALLITFLTNSVIAQQSLIYYWHFNNLVNFTTVAVSPSTFPVIRPNYTTLDSTKAFIKLAPLAGTTGNVATYYDNVSPGDILNARMGTAAGLGLRPRNPTDSMQLMFYIPSTSYKNISIKFETQKSSATNGAYTDSLDYSVDSGVTWRNSAISPLVASNGTGSWSTSVIYAAITDSQAFNNSKLVFRIRFIAPGNTGTSGNVRFDNVTVEGDSIQAPKLIYYWHFNNLVNFTTVAVSPSVFPVIRPNYTTLDSTKSFIKFAPLAGTVGNALTYYDNVSPGDTVNARMGQPAGLGLRPRNPSDSMQLMVYIPATGYKNILIKYETQKSSASNGAATDSMDYSLDSGVTWRNSGINPLTASNGSGSWSAPGSPVTASISDIGAWNNSKLVFRIRFIAPGNTGTSGNVRIDNLTIEGDTFVGTYPLPVNLISFTAQKSSDKNNLLNWQTASEINNDYFEVERAISCQPLAVSGWETVGKVKGHGTSNVENNYQFTDRSLPSSVSRQIYYRLNQVDINGTYTYSNIVSINEAILPSDISVENPVGNSMKIFFTTSVQSDISVSLINTIGLEVFKADHISADTNNTVLINLSGINTGIYFLKIKTASGELIVKKIVKQ